MELLDCDDLDENFFDSTIRDMLKNETRTLFCVDVTAPAGVPLAPVVSLVPGEDAVITGYKYPQEPNYVIINDLQPAKKVFSWMKSFCDGIKVPFPIVPVARPQIPPSYYEKRTDYYVIEEFFLSRGYLLLAPGIGSMERYPNRYVTEIERGSGKKYFMRRYDSQYDYEKGVTIVGMDFNPYSPYAGRIVKSAIIKSDRVKYCREYRGIDCVGHYMFRSKRYHADVWYRTIFPDQKHRVRDFMSLDLVTNTRKIERDIIFRLEDKDYLNMPIVIDPYTIREKKFKYLLSDKEGRYRNRIRSKLPYMIVFGTGKYLPYKTQPIIERGGYSVGLKEVSEISIDVDHTEDYYKILKSNVNDSETVILRNYNIEQVKVSDKIDFEKKRELQRREYMYVDVTKSVETTGIIQYNKQVAYRRKMLDDRMLDILRREMRRIDEARAVLIDPVRRRDYDDGYRFKYIEPREFYWYMNDIKRLVLKNTADRYRLERIYAQCRRYYVHNVPVEEYRGEDHMRQYPIKREWKVYVQDDNKDDLIVLPYKISRYPHNLEGSVVPAMYCFTLEEFLKSTELVSQLLVEPLWVVNFDKSYMMEEMKDDHSIIEKQDY